MTSLIQDVLLYVPSAGFLATSAVAVRYRGAQVNALRQVAARDEEARHLANTRLPALVYASQNGTGNSASPTGTTLHQQLARTETGLAYRSVLDQVDAALKAAETRAEASSRAAVQATTSSLQPLVYEIQTLITQLLATKHDEEMLARLQPLDHSASQLARRLQILAVITGKWPGRQRNDVPLLDAVRGGVSRIRDYLRVRVPREFPYYLSSRYVEPVVLAVAELLDNAARHSAPRTPVEVTFVDAHQGISIEIHDAGSGMTAEVRTEAARRLSGQHPVQLTKLRTPPAFGHLGVGALARQYGFTVRLDQEHSVHGGIRAIVFVPRTMLAAPPAADAGPVQERPPHTASAAADSTRADGHGYQVTGDGLALRPPPSRGPRHRAQQLTPSEPPPADSGRALAAFAQGTQTVHNPTPEAPATEEPPR
ncbi:ATP-binding protein [Streptomyces prunicolor]|uniref:ATP-binding protein n=1 Tax=Streptomyces prunicolor TaxID=67348 RepID=UPI002250F241|nr:ATP-binding protein [Streptomyces prunicolor]MCX5239067.1 ATP-binding protein [Streptomyces prunicolor]